METEIEVVYNDSESGHTGPAILAGKQAGQGRRLNWMQISGLLARISPKMEFVILEIWQDIITVINNSVDIVSATLNYYRYY